VDCVPINLRYHVEMQIVMLAASCRVVAGQLDASSLHGVHSANMLTV
jgi:hypothetical protein